MSDCCLMPNEKYVSHMMDDQTNRTIVLVTSRQNLFCGFLMNLLTLNSFPTDLYPVIKQ
jgi:hypothetical protein